MPDLVEQMYCSQQIIIPPNLPSILKKYAKAAIRTQPYDLLVWSSAYFRAICDGIPPPVKERIEYPPPISESGLSPGFLKVLINQIGKGDTVPKEILESRWKGVCLNLQYLDELICVGGFCDDVDWRKFIAVAAGSIESNLTRTMVLICELMTDEPEGGSASVQLELFIDLYRFLAQLDCGPIDFRKREVSETETVCPQITAEDHPVICDCRSEGPPHVTWEQALEETNADVIVKEGEIEEENQECNTEQEEYKPEYEDNNKGEDEQEIKEEEQEGTEEIEEENKEESQDCKKDEFDDAVNTEVGDKADAEDTAKEVDQDIKVDEQKDDERTNESEEKEILQADEENGEMTEVENGESAIQDVEAKDGVVKDENPNENEENGEMTEVENGKSAIQDDKAKDGVVSDENPNEMKENVNNVAEIQDDNDEAEEDNRKNIDEQVTKVILDSLRADEEDGDKTEASEEFKDSLEMNDTASKEYIDEDQTDSEMLKKPRESEEVEDMFAPKIDSLREILDDEYVGEQEGEEIDVVDQESSKESEEPVAEEEEEKEVLGDVIEDNIVTIIEPDADIHHLPTPVTSEISVLIEEQAEGETSADTYDPSQKLAEKQSLVDVRVIAEEPVVIEEEQEKEVQAHDPFWKHIPGIGPVVPEEIVEDLVAYLKVVASYQSNMVMPKNLRHFKCPPLEIIEN
ncbi:cilia- and flagella-associated protein 251-like [Cimex lectularius]|uniref:Ropporin-1-like protein n=1 Tax=Cimex lectularius TaxID=79782 RepID=A0A8I6RL42_CIMLE|nr:cilia- and flagella-associated protein 251-like [Cimex lectularius]